MRYSKANITTVLGQDDKAPEGVERVIVGNVMLTYPQCQVTTNWNYSDPTEVITKEAEQYLMHYKMAFDPAIINMSVLVGIKRIYGNTTSTPRDKFMPFYLIDQDLASQELIWEIQPPTDAMLRASVNASESCIEPSYVSTWLHAKG